MGTTLIICEKPSQAAHFAEALGGRSGCFRGQPYKIVNLVGHTMELCDPKDQVPANMAAQYKSWDLANLPWDANDFQWKKVIMKGKSSFVQGVKSAAAGCDSITIGTDVDPGGEGGLLAAEVLIHLGLPKKGQKLYRMYHDDESVKEVQKAFLNRKPLVGIDQFDEYRKANFRSRWDMLSMQFTRIATACGDGRSVLRQGRLKSAIVRLVGDQLADYNNYKKVPFYENRFRDENGNLYTNPKEPKFPAKNQVPRSYRPSSVTMDKQEIKHTAPPKLLNLLQLSAQMEGMGYKPAQVLSTYQKCYDDKILSYPRSEDCFVSPEQFNDMLPNIQKIAKVVGVDPGLLTHMQPRSTHVKRGGAHGANRPGPVVPPSLDWLCSTYGACAAVIYEILGRNYLAMLCEDYEYLSQTGHVTDYPDFKGSAALPQKPGWKAVFQDEFNDEMVSSKGLGIRAEPFVFEGFPPRPAYPTSKWLSKQLEHRRIGTPSTQTSIYAEVTNEKAKYPLLSAKRGRLSMTEYGEMSYRLLIGTHIGSLDMTEHLYAQMDDVSKGSGRESEYLADVARLVREDLITMKRNGEQFRKESGKTMANGFEQKEKAEGVWAVEQAAVKFNRQWGDHRFSDEEVNRLLAGQEISFPAMSKKGAPYTAKGRLERQSFNGHSYVGFKLSPRDDFPDKLCGHTFTEEERSDLQNGMEVYIQGFVSKKGKSFDAYLQWGKRGDGSVGFLPIGDNESIFKFQ